MSGRFISACASNQIRPGVSPSFRQCDEKPLMEPMAMEKIAEAGGLRSLEVVEINTALDVNNKTAELGVELILSALGKTIL